MDHSSIACKVYDETIPGPAIHVPVSLFTLDPNKEDVKNLLATGDTDEQGECVQLLPASMELDPLLLYELVAHARLYYLRQGGYFHRPHPHRPQGHS